MPAKAQAGLPTQSIDFQSINCSSASFQTPGLPNLPEAAPGGEWFAPSFPLSSPLQVFPACVWPLIPKAGFRIAHLPLKVKQWQQLGCRRPGPFFALSEA